MARKRLSDLLREEVQKPSGDEPVEAAADTSSEKTPTAAAGSGRSRSSSSKTANTKTTAASNSRNQPKNAEKLIRAEDVERAEDAIVAAIAKALDEEVMDEETMDEEAMDESKELDNPQSDTQMQLEAELSAAKTREHDLAQQLADLKTELKSSTTSAKKLQTSLDVAEQRIHQLQAELDDTKQTTLQLSETNAQLQTTIDTLKTQSAKSPSTPPRQPAPLSRQPAAAPPAAAKPAPSGTLSQQDIIRRRQADSLAHPVFPTGKLPSQSSDSDIGWFD
jgi:myosin heavy subunit